jgi:hypothetical protein
MNDCPVCSYPLVWSDDLARVRCSIYGDHPEQARAEPTPAELQQARWQRARQTRRLKVAS